MKGSREGRVDRILKKFVICEGGQRGVAAAVVENNTRIASIN
jgi:hypothetical protein